MLTILFYSVGGLICLLLYLIVGAIVVGLDRRVTLERFSGGEEVFGVLAWPFVLLVLLAIGLRSVNGHIMPWYVSPFNWIIRKVSGEEKN